MTRLYYVDEKGDHQVATMDDGMKFAGNTGLAIKETEQYHDHQRNRNEGGYGI